MQCLQRPPLTGCYFLTGVIHSETDKACARSPISSGRMIYANDLFWMRTEGHLNP